MCYKIGAHFAFVNPCPWKKKRRPNAILAKHTGKSIEEIDRDNYMTAEQAAAYGLVDRVLENGKDAPAS